MRIGHRRVTLIGADIAERRAELLAPQHGLARASARAEILRAAHLGTETRHEIAISRKAVDRKNDLAGDDLLAFAVRRLDIGADDVAVVVRQQRPCAIADRERNPALFGGGEKIVDQILSAARHRRVQPRHRMADMLVGRHQRHAGTDAIDQPLDRFRRGRDQTPEQIGAIGRTAGAKKIGDEPLG